jgi:aerobic C4-dicarboxylate transport protein
MAVSFSPSAQQQAEHESLGKRCCCGAAAFPLYAQVLLAVVLGTLLGCLLPDVATNPWIELLGTAFVKLIKMVIAPIIFCTIVSGIAHVADAVKVGRVALKAIVYFEIISTFALAIGLLVANTFRVGEGLEVTPDEKAVQSYAEKAKEHSSRDFLLNIIPTEVVGAFVEGNILQVLFTAILFGFALMARGKHGSSIVELVDELGHVMFGVISIIMKAAPIGAFGAMANTVGRYGPSTLGNLAGLVALFYLTAACFVVIVLGAVSAICRFNIFRFLFYIRAELLIVLGTSSSESVLPSLMEKLERLGCSRSVVGLVVPLGYSFNLDGTNIYMTLATLFITQAMGMPLSFSEQMTVLLVAMLTSKGATGVAGAGFITLASTLSAVRPELLPGMAILLGIDKFMSECRSLTNLIGNSVAAVVVSASEGELDRDMMGAALKGRTGVLVQETSGPPESSMEQATKRTPQVTLSLSSDSGLEQV